MAAALEALGRLRQGGGEWEMVHFRTGDLVVAPWVKSSGFKLGTEQNALWNGLEACEPDEWKGQLQLQEE